MANKVQVSVIIGVIVKDDERLSSYIFYSDGTIVKCNKMHAIMMNYILNEMEKFYKSNKIVIPEELEVA